MNVQSECWQGEPALLLTGGGGKYVTNLLRHQHTFDPDMTRKGLALLYRLNQK